MSFKLRINHVLHQSSTLHKMRIPKIITVFYRVNTDTISQFHRQEWKTYKNKETRKQRRTSYIVILYDMTGEWNHIDTNFATAMTINLPGPTLSQQQL